MEPTIFLVGTGRCSQHCILSRLRHLSSCKLFSIINVYVPDQYQEKSDFWRSLLSLAKEENLGNLILTGVFNATLYPWERKGGYLVREPGREVLEDLILTLELVVSNLGRVSTPGQIGWLALDILRHSWITF
jgi:hypothetical protein